MPMYDYKCEHCGHVEEMLVMYADTFPYPCPDCHKNGELHIMDRQLSAPGLVKGGDTPIFRKPKKRKH